MGRGASLAESAEIAEKCRNWFHHRDTEDTEFEGYFFVCRRGTDRQKGSASSRQSIPRSGEDWADLLRFSEGRATEIKGKALGSGLGYWDIERRYLGEGKKHWVKPKQYTLRG